MNKSTAIAQYKSAKKALAKADGVGRVIGEGLAGGAGALGTGILVKKMGPRGRQVAGGVAAVAALGSLAGLGGKHRHLVRSFGFGVFNALMFDLGGEVADKLPAIAAPR